MLSCVQARLFTAVEVLPAMLEVFVPSGKALGASSLRVEVGSGTAGAWLAALVMHLLVEVRWVRARCGCH